MNICYVANNRFPSERAHMTQIVQMCNAFVACGHTVTLLVTDRKTNIQETPEKFFGVSLNFTVVQVAVPDIAGRAQKIPVVLHPCFLMIQRLVFAIRAVRFIKHQEYALLYGRDEWVFWFISFFTKTPAVWESHEARCSFAARRLLQKKYPLVVISEGIRDFYIQKGIARERILVAHDAVDARFFEEHISNQKAREILNITSTKPIVMYIGGLEDWKGGETLFKASKNQDAFDTYVIGGKEEEIKLFRQKYPHIYFLGPRPYRDLPALQQAADVLVIPNTGTVALSALYTSPLKLFSYMTAKKAIVAACIPSIMNILNDTEAYFFTADDTDDLQHVIKMVIQHPKEAEKKAKRAHEKGRHYSWSKRAESILTFFTEYSRSPSLASVPHTDNRTRNQIIPYIFVGSWVAAFNYFSFYFIFDVIGSSYVYASAISFVLTVLVSFVLQRNITFRNMGVQKKKTVRHIGLFYANALLGLFLNTCIMLVGVDYLQLSPYVSQGISIIVLASYNFFIYRLILTQ